MEEDKEICLVCNENKEDNGLILCSECNKPEPTINDIKRQIEEDEECGGCGFYTSDPDSQPLENCETCGRESVWTTHKQKTAGLSAVGAGVM